jgi:hypothetical protein
MVPRNAAIHTRKSGIFGKEYRLGHIQKVQHTGSAHGRLASTMAPMALYGTRSNTVVIKLKMSTMITPAGKLFFLTLCCILHKMVKTCIFHVKGSKAAVCCDTQSVLCQFVDVEMLPSSQISAHSDVLALLMLMRACPCMATESSIFLLRIIHSRRNNTQN